MNDAVKDHVEDPHMPGEIELYGDPGIATYDAPVPKFLMFTYIILPICGLIALYLYWDGSHGWLDRGYWYQLQAAANTTTSDENFYRNQDHSSGSTSPVQD